jgi:membrane-associated phospholipid phosphatase
VWVSNHAVVAMPDAVPMRPGRPSLRERLEPLAAAWRPLTVVAVVLVVALSVTGLVLTHALDDSGIVRWDLHVENWFVDHRTPLLDGLARAGTWFAETFVVPVVLAIAIVVAWRLSSRVAAPIYLVAAVGGEKLIYFVSSLIVGRDRPPVPTVGTNYATTSFPSGHVSSAITLYGSIALLIALERSHAVRRALLLVVAVITAIVAACRMYAGFHFPTDVIAGIVLGSVWLTVVYHTVLLRSPLWRRTEE